MQLVTYSDPHSKIKKTNELVLLDENRAVNVTSQILQIFHNFSITKESRCSQ